MSSSVSVKQAIRIAYTLPDGEDDVPSKRLTEEGVRTLKPTPGKQVSYFDKIVPGLLLRVSWGGAKQWRVLQYVRVPHPVIPEKHRTVDTHVVLGLD